MARRTRTALFVPGTDARPLRHGLFQEMVQDFDRPRSLNPLPDLPPGVAQRGVRALLNELGIRAPSDDINVRYTYRVVPLMRRIAERHYRPALAAVQDAIGLDPVETERRCNAVLAELYIAPVPFPPLARGECPWAHWSWDGEWLRCRWEPGKHPEGPIHADSSVPGIGKWHQLDMRSVNLEYWQ